MVKKVQPTSFSLMTYEQATQHLSPEEKTGQLFMPAAFINDSEEAIVALETLIKKYHIGGLCFFHSRASAATNYEGKRKVPYNAHSLQTLKALIERYQKVAAYPLLIAIDAEWGLAMRVENTSQYPYAICLGAIKNNEELLFEVGKNIALDCRAAGIHWNFAPVADINNNPGNPVIGYRSFGENVGEVTKKAVAFMRGTQRVGVLTSAKHFPGHGDTATDSHLGLPVIEKNKAQLQANELVPFAALIKNHVDSVMVGHLAVPSLSGGEKIPASLSNQIIKGLLRKELGFKGVVVSDALNMHSVSKRFPVKGELEWAAFNAGNDVLCFAEHIPQGIAAILSKASSEQLEASFERVWKLKQKTLMAHSQEPQDNLKLLPDLTKKLAGASLTLSHGDGTFFQYFKSRGFVGIALSQQPGCHFFSSIQKELAFEFISTATTSIREIKKVAATGDNVLIALFPPKIKPHQNFEIPEEQINFIHSVQETKNLIVYLFGNPYVLPRLSLKKAKEVVVAYQDFQIFQENAAQHFLGKVPADGKLPFTIKNTLDESA